MPARVIDGGGAAPWQNTPPYFILGHSAGLAHDADVRRGAAWLLAHGANPNRVCYPDKSGETPLHAAARNWDAEMIELLVRHAADVHARRRDGRTALTLAQLNGSVSAAEALRAHGAVDELTAADRFIAACMRGDHVEAERRARLQRTVAHADFPGVARALLAAGAQDDARDEHPADDVLEVFAEFRRSRK